MILLGEPIATWLSVAALFISLLALLLSRRKYLYDQKINLAKQIADIRREYGDTLLALDQILDLLKKGMPDYKSDTLSKFRLGVDKLYTELGKQEPITNDPLKLSSIAVESKFIKDSIQQLLHTVNNIVDKNSRPMKKTSPKSKTRK